MRALTVRQPWAWAIIHGGKNVENRSRNIAGSYRGPVAIHVATRAATSVTIGGPLTDAMDAAIDRGEATWNREPWWANVGHIIGVVDLVDVHHGDECESDVPAMWDTIETQWCSPWALPGHHHLVLANPRPLATQIPAKGRLGLWRPDDVLVQRITAELARAGVTS